jgi:hypothetical protein
MVTESPPVSPSVVAAILIIQKTSVTSGTFVTESHATDFPMVRFLAVPAASTFGTLMRSCDGSCYADWAREQGWLVQFSKPINAEFEGLQETT